MRCAYTNFKQGFIAGVYIPFTEYSPVILKRNLTSCAFVPIHPKSKRGRRSLESFEDKEYLKKWYLPIIFPKTKTLIVQCMVTACSLHVRI